MTGDAHEVARLVVEMLKAEGLVAPVSRPRAELVDAATVATTLGVGRAWVYDHKTELGGRPLGNGTRPRWRFDLAVAITAYGELAAAATTPPLATPPSRRRRVPQPASGLLPIKPSTQRSRRA
ncbi:MAG TPA: hypothetical protein VGM33_12730 [Baekduia sp.]|jgi:hypothetical protein